MAKNMISKVPLKMGFDARQFVAEAKRGWGRGYAPRTGIDSLAWCALGGGVGVDSGQSILVVAMA